MQLTKLAATAAIAVSGLSSTASARPLGGFSLQNMDLDVASTLTSGSPWSLDNILAKLFGGPSPKEDSSSLSESTTTADRAASSVALWPARGDDDDTKVPGESPFYLCDTDVPHLATITHIDLSPNPPARGKALNVSAGGTLGAPITEGAYIEVDVRYGYIRLLKQNFDLCEQVENVDLTCPVDKGDLELTKSVDLPDEIPPGKYVVIARAFTAEDALLTCLTATVEFPAAF